MRHLTGSAVVEARPIEPFDRINEHVVGGLYTRSVKKLRFFARCDLCMLDEQTKWTSLGAVQLQESGCWARIGTVWAAENALAGANGR